MDKHNFTSNDEIDEFADGDTLIQLKGYIDSVDGIKTVRDGKKILRFIVNNGNGRRVRVLVWDNFTQSYATHVCVNKIVSFSRLRCSPASNEYANPNEDVIKKELNVIGCTKVTWGEKLVGKVVEPKKIELQNIIEEYGLVSADAYIGIEFEESRYRNNVHGNGAITDGTFRVKVQVQSYSQEAADLLKPGTHVKVTGKIWRDKVYDYAYIQCNSMADIVQIDDEILSADKLKNGFRTPKRKRTDENSSPNKRDSRDSLASLQLILRLIFNLKSTWT
ncbi:uncharacterized protein LOC130670518 [Microplitis mediator]|uniref:uncharacterized protein LOC130670518 n=1 Tax=Microplitis mediator TaxID=375433 RepID=UPI002553799E|nr:uncharacterized protein LOC130670518 [Microplitis mediator]